MKNQGTVLHLLLYVVKNPLFVQWLFTFCHLTYTRLDNISHAQLVISWYFLYSSASLDNYIQYIVATVVDALTGCLPPEMIGHQTEEPAAV